MMEDNTEKKQEATPAEGTARERKEETQQTPAVDGADAVQAQVAEMKAELEALRAERQALSAASAAGAGPGEASPVAAMELPSQIQEFVERLDQELKDVHPSTLIAVFGLGVLIGWILPR
jgi:alkylation response protein AidB-like acyl-CoA dehydrogenase